MTAMKLIPAMILALLLVFGCGTLTTENPEPTAAEPAESTTPEATEPEMVEATEPPPEATESAGETTEISTGVPELDALREGGFVVFVRHPETDASPVSADADGHLANLEDCSLQRNLTDAGRDDARSLGAGVRSLGIPVGGVFASPYCRTGESAELAFGEAEEVPELATPRYLAPGDPEADERVAYLRTLFSTPPAEGGNAWVFTHELNLRLASGGESVPEGGAVVFEPRGDGGFEVFATLPAEWWAAGS